MGLCTCLAASRNGGRRRLDKSSKKTPRLLARSFCDLRMKEGRRVFCRNGTRLLFDSPNGGWSKIVMNEVAPARSEENE